jgi:hypothetical protein
MCRNDDCSLCGNRNRRRCPVLDAAIAELKQELEESKRMVSDFIDAEEKAKQRAIEAEAENAALRVEADEWRWNYDMADGMATAVVAGLGELVAALRAEVEATTNTMLAMRQQREKLRAEVERLLAEQEWCFQYVACVADVCQGAFEGTVKGLRAEVERLKFLNAHAAEWWYDDNGETTWTSDPERIEALWKARQPEQEPTC